MHFSRLFLQISFLPNDLAARKLSVSHHLEIFAPAPSRNEERKKGSRKKKEPIYNHGKEALLFPFSRFLGWRTHARHDVASALGVARLQVASFSLGFTRFLGTSRVSFASGSLSLSLSPSSSFFRALVFPFALALCAAESREKKLNRRQCYCRR